jgi:hypothetical protein
VVNTHLQKLGETGTVSPFVGRDASRGIAAAAAAPVGGQETAAGKAGDCREQTCRAARPAARDLAA